MKSGSIVPCHHISEINRLSVTRRYLAKSFLSSKKALCACQSREVWEMAGRQQVFLAQHWIGWLQSSLHAGTCPARIRDSSSRFTRRGQSARLTLADITTLQKKQQNRKIFLCIYVRVIYIPENMWCFTLWFLYKTYIWFHTSNLCDFKACSVLLHLLFSRFCVSKGICIFGRECLENEDSKIELTHRFLTLFARPEWICMSLNCVKSAWTSI